MNKLEERFEDILDDNIEFAVKPTGEDEWDYTDVFKKQAKEAKDIAIEFAEYILKQEAYLTIAQYVRMGNKLNTDVLDKFVDEKYGE